MNFELLPPIILDSVDSTNAAAMRLLKDGRPIEGTCIRANYQTAGRGQRNNHWQSDTHENLLVSFILYPSPHLSSMPFSLSKTIALAVHQTLCAFASVDVKIKWPNDLLIGGKKAAGILIENQWSGSSWSAAIAGIGINVNQRIFEVNHATSISAESAKNTPIEEVLSELQRQLSHFYERLCNGDYAAINQAYHQHLFGRNDTYTYEIREGKIQAKVVRVLDDGQVELITEKGATNSYQLSEIRLMY
jgi:BirA family biotin operon repressor/biotin-[acetyl-CoA-carboxylase] ligase